MTQPARTLTDADVAAIADAVADRLRGCAPVSEAPANEAPPKRRRKRDLSHVVPTDMDYALAAQVQRRLGIVPKRRYERLRAPVPPTVPPALVELARSLVAQPSGPALEALVAAAEQLEVVRLVREVRDGGPFAMRRGIELAALLLDASAQAQGTKASAA